MILNDWAVFLMKSGDLNGARSKFKLSLRENRFNVFTYFGILALAIGPKGRYVISFPKWLRYYAVQVKRAFTMRFGQ